MNLHLGLAYERMTVGEYCSLVGADEGQGKPNFNRQTDVGLLKTMVLRGCQALQDAFCAINDCHLTNVFNSSTGKIEEFDAESARDYSQQQCAIAIERVFSGLYKYLHFKSTTGEVIPKRVNIDSGYKYLSTSSLRTSMNPVSRQEGNGIYYDD